MGVRGLKSFLERENQIWTIIIDDEISKWKRENPDKTPKIVIDFMSLTHCVAKKENDTICGGRHKITLDSWTKLLDAFKAAGCELIFFADLTIQDGKTNTWLSRRNEKFDFYISLYELINVGASVDTIIATVQEKKGLTSTFHAMEAIAETYGEFHRAVKHECDLELAQYAKRENALAVITNDTDFLIFDGTWRLWSSNDIQFTTSNQLKTTEYNRNGLKQLCSLNQRQLPLLATLVGNDFTNKYNDHLYSFQRSIGPMRNKFQNIARYVREFGNGELSDNDIKQITARVFKNSDNTMVKLIKESIDSYKTDFPPPTIDDALEKKLLKTRMYRPYVGLMSEIQGLTMPFYDMYNSERGTNFPMMLADWLKRKVGILRFHNKDDSFTFTLMAKKHINQFYSANIETPIYPNFDIPTLEDLYLGKDDTETIEIKWKIFGWIMSLSDETITAMKKLPKDFLLTTATLYALVKKGLIGMDEADGILHTEWKVQSNDEMDVEYPKLLTVKHVRAAHLYNITFAHVRLNFAIAGLSTFIQELLQFDGVYYQQLMKKWSNMNSAERDTFIAPIKDYRIYA